MGTHQMRSSERRQCSTSTTYAQAIMFMTHLVFIVCMPSLVTSLSPARTRKASHLHPTPSIMSSSIISPPISSFNAATATTTTTTTSTTLHSTPPRRAYEGRPSSPGWKRGRLEQLTDWATNDEPNRAVICEYEAGGSWLWTRFGGTVLSMCYNSVLGAMALSIVVDRTVRALATSDPWPLLAVPPSHDPLIEQLSGINMLWEYQLTLSTFILTFFISQAYTHWRTVYLTTRSIQGRINDICMLLTIGAERLPDSDRGSGTTYSSEAENLITTCTRLIRLSHTFFWAATPTLSNGVGDSAKDDPQHLRSNSFADDIGPLLLSPQGLRGLSQAGQLTQDEVQALLSSGLPPSQYAYVLLEWVGLHALEGLESGIIRGTAGLEENLFRQFTSLRAEYFNIGDFAAGRMPLAYVQLVQILVDSLVVLATVALYPDLGSLSIPLTGLLCLFYKGLLELSKSFLDPFGVEGYPGQNIRVDVLVSELNFGAESRWVTAGAHVPAYPKMDTCGSAVPASERTSLSSFSSFSSSVSAIADGNTTADPTKESENSSTGSSDPVTNGSAETMTNGIIAAVE